MRTGRRGRDTATHPPSDYNESPAGDNPDIPTHPTRNMRKKRNITSTPDPIIPTPKEPIIEAVLAKEGNITITSSAAPAPTPLSAGSKAAKKREKSRKKKIEKAQKVAANITRRLGDTGTGSPEFDPIIETLRAR